MLKGLLLGLIGVTNLAMAVDCDEVRKQQQPKAKSIEGLNAAVAMFAIAPDTAKCLYPDVQVTPMPVGEYEHFDDQDILKRRGVTLSARVKYTWDELSMVSAVLIVAPGLVVETNALESGQVMVLAVSQDEE